MPLRTIHPAEGLGDAKRRVNIVVLSEGFTSERMEVFFNAVRKFTSVLLTVAPFSRFPSLISVSALFVPSAEGIGQITNVTRCDWRTGTPTPGDDMPSPYQTAFGALFCRTTSLGESIERSLWGDSTKVNQAVAAEPAIAALHVLERLVLVDNVRADGGEAHDNIGWYSMKPHPIFGPDDWIRVAIHELGHSAFGLADEYDTDGTMQHDPAEPSEPNITTRQDRAGMLAQWDATNSKRSLTAWHDMISETTPLPTTPVNPDDLPLSGPPEKQTALPGVPAGAVGLFEGAHHSPSYVYRPRLLCIMRNHNTADFCPVCDWAIQAKVARVGNPMYVNFAKTVPGMWTVLASYFELPSRAPERSELSRLLFYAGTTGEYQIHEGTFSSQVRSAPGASTDLGWTTLIGCEIGGVPHILAHSLVMRRFAIYEVVDNAGTAALEVRFDTGLNGSAFTHIASFVRAGLPHFIGYTAATGELEISRLDSNLAAPVLVYGTAQDATRGWLPRFTLITTFTIDGVPYVLKHNAASGEVHIQSLDPPGWGPNTFISPKGHWNPGASIAVAYETLGRCYLRRTSAMNYEAFDWIWPGATGVESMYRRQRVDITVAMAEVRGKTSAGFAPYGFHQIAALDMISGQVRFSAH